MNYVGCYIYYAFNTYADKETKYPTADSTAMEQSAYQLVTSQNSLIHSSAVYVK
jgi:hypothetical protein